jgi:divalent metal cation (Fe/Co/Zn/Cd) transporter
MLDAAVQSAFVVIVAWLIGLGVKFFNFPIDPTVINSVAAALVAYIVSKLFPPAVRSLMGKK